ncbi:MAG TPA: ATP-binding protein, partial [Thermoanaerobaculia bacterium]
VSTQENLFRIAQEGLSNIARHARPASVQVRLEADSPDLRLSIHDDGQGFDPAAATAGMGLRSMRERLAALGGDLDVESAPGQGTTLSARVPLTVPSPDESDESLRLRRVKAGAFFAFLTLLGIGETLVVSAIALFFAGRIILEERSRRSRFLSQQLIFVAALLFWWNVGTPVPELPSATLSGLQWYAAMLEYALTQTARLLSPLSPVLIAWELWKSRRAADTLYYNRELLLFVLLLLLASLPCLLIYDPGLVGTIASRIAALAYAVWFLRLLAEGR